MVHSGSNSNCSSNSRSCCGAKIVNALLSLQLQQQRQQLLLLLLLPLFRVFVLIAADVPFN